MNRPVLVAVIGYIIGIIMGLYFEKSIVFFYSIIILITILSKLIITYKKKNIIKRKFKIFRIYRYARYLKLILNLKTILIIIIFSIISNTIVIIRNQKFDKLYKDIDELEAMAIIVSSKQEKEYSNLYKIKVISINSSFKYNNTLLYLKTKKNKEFKYGDVVLINGKFKQPQEARNFRGFNYKNYLKTLNIYGTIEATGIKSLKDQSYIKEKLGNLENGLINILKSINDIRERIIKNAKEYFQEDIYSVYMGLILGDTSNIEENLYEQFSGSNMLHILAVSGMHISFIILGLNIILKKILGKKIVYVVTIIVLILYSFIAGFSPSIIRASIMGIMIILGKLIHRKNDTCTTMAISAIAILIYNPFLITSISFQYTYAGTIGIILLYRNILKIINTKNKISKIKELIAISISSQIFLLPLTLYNFNTIGIYFLLTNILLGFIICPVVVFGFIFTFILIFNVQFLSFLSYILSFSIKLIIFISNIGKLPFARNYIQTPSVIGIIIYYFFLIILNWLYSIKNKNKLNGTEIRIKQTMEVCKYRIRKKKESLKYKGKKVIALSSILVIIVIFNLIFNHKILKIFFIDVGQGDCCFIITPENKTILIDGGGSESDTFDVGKKTVIPYILDRGYNKIDYIFISHFDSDHIRAEFYR